MKLQKILSGIISTVIMGSCVLSNISVANAEDFTNYGMGDKIVTSDEVQELSSQFDESDSAINLNSTSTLPSKWDLSNSKYGGGYFPPIGKQGELDSCVAWTSTYYQFTYAANKLNGITTNANNAYSPTWTYNFLNNGLNITTDYNNAYKLLKLHGALKMADMPYNGDETKYNYSWSTNTSAMMEALKTRVSNDGKVEIAATGTPITTYDDNDLENVKKLLKDGHVLLVRIQAESQLNNWSFKQLNDRPSETVAYRARRAADNYGHAMVIVGYDDDVWCDVNGNGDAEDFEMGAFKVANSWGTGWKNNGYVWVLYDALNKVSANTVNNWQSSESGTRISIFDRGWNDVDANANVFHYIEVANYDVNMAGVLTINTENRYCLRVNLFRNMTNSHEYTAANSISFLNLNEYKNSYGQAPFNGSLVFDYGKFDDPVDVCTDGYYYGVDIINNSSSNTSYFSKISYNIVDDKFNVIKKISTPTFMQNNFNVRKNVKVSCIKGDVDYDGAITSNDSTIISDYVSMRRSLSNLQYYLGDFNNDGEVNVADVVSINIYISENTTSQSELQAVYDLNEKIKKFMIANNYSQSEIEKVNEANSKISNQIEMESGLYEKK